jgi:hypothetical protein
MLQIVLLLVVCFAVILERIFYQVAIVIYKDHRRVGEQCALVVASFFWTVIKIHRRG